MEEHVHCAECGRAIALKDEDGEDILVHAAQVPILAVSGANQVVQAVKTAAVCEPCYIRGAQIQRERDAQSAASKLIVPRGTVRP